MKAFGLPARLVDKWFLSIAQMHRFWDISKQTSKLIPSPDGCPEGDAWSVLAMLVVSECWSRLLQFHAQYVRTVSYADNWTMWSKDDELQARPTLVTCSFVEWMGLQISWNKTWLWSTGTTGAKKLAEVLQPHVPLDLLEIKENATDLGCQMTYHGGAKLGVIHDRLACAKKRLDILKHATWIFPLKAHVVLTNVMPVALYGCELLAIGQRHLSQLRTTIADALVGETVQSMNPGVFLACADLHILGPHLFVIVQSVKLARKVLRTLDNDMRQVFLKLVATPVKTTGLTQGPASALREYLLRLGLTCSGSGDIQMTALRSCNLLTTPFKDLQLGIQRAWYEQLLMFHSQRTKLYNTLPIHSDEMCRLLHKFNPKQRLLLLREIAGAFQTGAQVSKWEADTTGECEYCGNGSDTRWHRAAECSAFHDIRQPHMEVIDDLRDFHETFVELPVIHFHPHWEFMTRYCGPCLPLLSRLKLLKSSPKKLALPCGSLPMAAASTLNAPILASLLSQ